MRADFIDFLRLSPLHPEDFWGMLSNSFQIAKTSLDPVRFTEQNGTPDELQSSRPHGDKVADYRHL
jgi:hypothetical protein